MSWIHVAILFPLFFAIIVPFLYKWLNKKIHTGWFVIFVPFMLFIYLLTYLPIISNGRTFYQSVSWIPSLDFNFSILVDGLSLIFGLLITGIGTLVILYSIYYMSKEKEALHNFYVYLLLFMGAMLGVVFSDNVFVLYVFWELTSVSSLLLIAYWYQRKKSRYGAQKSMLITITGGLAMLAGFIILSIITNTTSIQEMISHLDIITASPLFIPAMILILIGAFTKSAQFPFSIWLPDAMEAPTPISSYLHSATMVKAGIYLVARFTPIFGGSFEWFWLVTGVGIITLIYGSITAVKQTDLKALLAYSTISQLGLIMSLLGMGSASLYYGVGEQGTMYMVAVTAAIFHLINHSTFKGCLFMVVGIIDHETGTRDIRKLGGLINLMPISFTLMLIGAFSMAGLPPFNGFLSKEMFFTGVLNASSMQIFGMENLGLTIPIIAWIASVFTFIYCFILVIKTFLGKYQPEKLERKAHEAPIGMLVSPIILASLVVIFFFFPNILSKYLLEPALLSIVPIVAEAGVNVNIFPWYGFNPELYMTLAVIAVGTFMFIYIKKWYWLYRIMPASLLNRMYDYALEKSERSSFNFTKGYMTGFTRDYILYIFIFMIVIVGAAFFTLSDYHFSITNSGDINIFEWILLLGIVASALAVVFVKSRLTALIAVGALGYLVSSLFVVFRAPDLALTQLVVETVSVALFLLCFYHLPELRNEENRIRFKATNFIISVATGALVSMVALASLGNEWFESISSYFENSYGLAGAKNMVNAILVDFRGFDTLIEILVLLIAGLGVYILIKLSKDRRKKFETEGK